MTQTVKAKFTNGVLTPLEPLDLDEDNVVLVTVAEVPGPARENSARPFRVKPVSRGFAPGVDPAKLKDLLCDMDDAEFFRKLNP